MTDRDIAEEYLNAIIASDLNKDKELSGEEETLALIKNTTNTSHPLSPLLKEAVEKECTQSLNPNLNMIDTKMLRSEVNTLGGVLMNHGTAEDARSLMEDSYRKVLSNLDKPTQERLIDMATMEIRTILSDEKLRDIALKELPDAINITTPDAPAVCKAITGKNAGIGI